MTDVRSPDDLVAMVTALQAKVDDMESTFAVRAARRPTGDVEFVMRTTPKTGSLILNGQTVSRTEYPVLWQFAQEQALVIAGMFTVGDGSTTFTLPDWRGRVPIAAGALGTDTYAIGQLGGLARVSLSVAELAAHGHTVASASASSTEHQHDSDAQHSHGISSDGSHAGHNSGATPIAGGSGASAATSTQNSAGGHSHGGGTSGAGAHTHGMSGGHTHPISLSLNNTGSGTAHENRPPFFVGNWIVYV